MVNKYMIFYVTFWNSYHAIGHLTVGLEYPWDNESSVQSEQRNDDQTNEGSVPSASIPEGQDMEHRTEKTTRPEPDSVHKETQNNGKSEL